MKRITFTVLILLLIINQLDAQNLLGQFSFTACSACQNSASDFQPEFGYIYEIQQNNVTASSISNKFRAKNWNTNDNIDLSKYYYFKIGANSSYQLNLSKIELDEYRNTTGIRKWCLRSSVDNFTENLAFFEVPDDSKTRKSQTINLSQNSAFQNTSQEIEFRFYAYNAETTAGQWTIDNLKIYGEIPDIVPPTLLDIQGQNQNQIKLIFSEKITQSSALKFANYSFYPNLEIKNISQQYQDNQIVIIEFENNLVQNSEYQITLKNLEDEAGNRLNLETKTFVFSDNSPPEISNIEVNSAYSIDVYFDKKVTKNSAETLSNYQLFDEDSILFTSPISAILSPEKDKVSLFFDKNLNENETYEILISELQDMHGNQNILNQNYFQLDTKKPKIENIKAISENQLELYFSEIIDPVSAEIYAHYSIYDEIGTPNQIKLISDKKVQLTFQENFKLNKEYRIKISNIQDLQGNIISNTYLSFYYDLKSPNITKIDVISDNQIRLVFDENLDETSAEILTNYFITNLNQNPTQAELNAYFPNIVTLTFANITNQNELNLNVLGVKDVYQNEIQNSINQIFSTKNSFLYEIHSLSEKQLSLHFSQPLQKISAENKLIYETSNGIGNPSNVQINETDFTTVILTLNKSLELFEKYNINISEITDIQNDKSKNLTQDFIYQNYIESVYPISENVINITFKYPPEKLDAEDKQMYEIVDFANISVAIQDLENPKIVHLQFTSAFKSDKNYTLKINNLKLLSEQITPVQTHIFRYDSRPPSVESVMVVNKNELLVKFSEAVADNVENLFNFLEVNHGIGHPETIEKDAIHQNYVSLKFTNLFQLDKQYILSAQYVEDLQNNRMIDEQNISFQRPKQAQFQELVFNEIFADPEPSQQLPTYEFLELYNNSDETYNLGGLQLSDGNTTKILDNYELKSHEYLILCPKEAFEKYQNYGNVLALDSWLSLTNSGKNLYLKDWDENTIDSVSYSDKWYQNSEKKEGGWSLEKIDYQLNCTESEQWTASVDLLGGTPAKQNSVYQNYADSISTKIEKIDILGLDTLQIFFSETAQKTDLENTSNYIFKPHLSISEINVLDTQNVQVLLNQKIDSSLIYTIYTTNLKDCAGNSERDTATFAIGQRAEKNDLIISEIMPKESDNDSLQIAEYIEIYNPSQKLISLNSIILEDATGSIFLPSYFIQSGEYLVLTAQKNTHLFTNVLGVSGFPSLNNSGEKLTLRDTSGYAIFSVEYSDSLLQKFDKNNGGYSLEIIDLNNFETPNNWSISTGEKGGTPAQKNQPLLDFSTIIEDKIEENSKELIVHQITLVDSKTIKVSFNQKMDINLINTKNVYLLNTIDILDFEIQNDSILMIYSDKNLDFTTIHQLVLNDIQSESRNTLKLYYYNIVITKKSLENTLLITEIMADETPTIGLPESEYIEIYNSTDSIINLSEVQFEDEKSAIILPQYYLLPHDFAVICSASKAHLFEQKNVLGVSNFPSLNNSGENLILRNIQNNEIIFSVKYSDNWYQNSEKEDGGWALEMIDINAKCQGKNNWRASQNETGGTPVKQNSFHDEIHTFDAPKLESITVENDTVLRLFFDMDLDTLALNLSNFQIVENIQIKAIHVFQKNQIKLITNLLSDDNEYNLILNDISDCFGKRLEKQVFEFKIGAKPHYKEFKITEIMIDPTPSVNLPEIEYFELYNSTKKMLSLSNLKLTNGKDTVSFSDYILEPENYLLVCHENDIQEFKLRLPKVKIIGIENLFSFKNTNSNLTLLTPNDELLFSVEYDNSFYKHPEKDAGGWSLEMRDLNYACAGSRNWEASNNPNGGTPAEANSVQFAITDLGLPNLEKVEIVSSDSLLLSFDSELDFSNIDKFEITLFPNQNTTIQSIHKKSNYELLVILSDRLKNGIMYQISIKNIYSCNGKVQLNKQKLVIQLPQKAEIGDILLNEILFNPPVNGVDFVEVYNNSSKFIDLKNWWVANNSDTNRITAETFIIQPYNYVVFTENIEQFKYFYPLVPDSLLFEMNLPSFPDLEGKVALLNLDKIQFDVLHYSEDWHSDLLNNTEGVSLERISINLLTDSYDNWTSSTFPIYATPAKINSQILSLNNTIYDESCISFNSEIITPNQDGFDDFLLIQFDCLEIGTVGNIDIYDASGRKIIQLVQNQLLSNNSFIRWDAINEFGKTVRSGYFILYFELFDNVGNIQKIRKTVVISNRLR